ncbi:MAG TPA: glucan ABC transporter ATP-binding protein/ permease [Pseudolabrys sp.]
MSFIRLYGRVLDQLGPDRRVGWLLAFANVTLAIAQFAEPVLFGRVINVLAGAQGNPATADWARLWLLLAAWVGFGFFTIGCGTLVALYADRLAHRRRLAVLTSYFEHVLQLPLAYHGEVHSGRLMKIMLQGTDTLWAFWLGFFREHLAAFVSLVILVPLALTLNWRLAILLIVLCVLFALLTALVLRKTETMQSSVQAHHSDLAERASDALGNIALVQSYARVESEVRALQSVSERLLAAQFPVLSWWAVLTVLTRASTTLAVLSIIAVGTWLFQKGLITIGEIVTFMALAGMVITRLEQAVSFANRMALDAAQLREFFRVLDTVPAMHDRAGAVDPGRFAGRVEFDNVSFAYDGTRPAVSALTFTAEPGETVALVGATGAGKSTALMLLHRGFDPQSGCIRIDGKDIREVQLGALRRNIGVVFQEALLFNRSIAENLRVGKPDASHDQMRAAAAGAQALDFIDRNPDGFDAHVGERGRSLSGGERQRLSIARALLKDPPILILDEATSALDATTEQRVLAALDEVMKNRTTFVIAHRLATIRRATRILVFDGGRIVESGTFDELQRLGGRFTQLSKAQFLPIDA